LQPHDFFASLSVFCFSLNILLATTIMRFTEEISKFLVELVRAREKKLFPDSQKKDARATQESAWNEVHREIINKYPTSGIELKHCKTKWTDLKKAAKKDNQKTKR
jgi:hypothetical protein